MNAAQAKAALQALTVLSMPCPLCKVGAGVACVGPNDRQRAPHQAREDQHAQRRLELHKLVEWEEAV